MFNMETIKLLTGEICFALLGNINKNISTVSFDYIEDNRVHIQFILKSKSEIEEEMIEDTIAEFEALHGSLKELKWDIYLQEDNQSTLSNLVFASYDNNQTSKIN